MLMPNPHLSYALARHSFSKWLIALLNALIIPSYMVPQSL